MNFPPLGPSRLDKGHPFQRKLTILGILSALSSSACGEKDNEASFQLAASTAGAALTAVHGTASDDVWLVGAKDAQGPLVLRFDGKKMKREALPLDADLWWVFSLSDKATYLAGSDATIVFHDGSKFERMKTPGLGKHTVFGVWAGAQDDVYAVGSVAGRNGFIWHYDGKSWLELELPEGIPLDENNDTPSLFKVTGCSADEVWIVGDRGIILRGNAREGFRLVDSDSEEKFFTVQCTEERAVIVGGSAKGKAYSVEEGQLDAIDVDGAALLQGAHVSDTGEIWMSGQGGVVLRAKGSSASEVELKTDVESLHGTWVDPEGNVWVAGGEVISGTMKEGRAYRRGPSLDAYELGLPDPGPAVCPPEQVDPSPEGSIARRINEQLLNAVRRDIPRPTVHARNLYHTSAAMWDAWAAFDETARGTVLDEKTSLSLEEREAAIAHAGYQVLHHRYRKAIGGPVSEACFKAFMESAGFDPADEDTEGDTGAALGNRIGKAVISAFAEDGSQEATDYSPPSDQAYVRNGVPLIVDLPGTSTKTPLIWEPLVLAEAVTQNGIDLGSGVQSPIGWHWRDVTPFAMERPSAGEPYHDFGTAPLEWDARLREAVIDVLTRSSQLEPSDEATIDISPGAYGNNSLGTNDGMGHAENPVTGEPYAKNEVLLGDFTRVLAEFWADGPKSETPPGHWNTLANQVSDSPDLDLRLFGEGPELDRLSWDVHLYLALNGAVHDAAIAAWELKRVHQTARPITLIRYYGALGQSTDPDLPSYHKDGLPLIEDLIELITEESSQEGERHAHLSPYLGELAVRSWRGEPGDREGELGGVDWIRVKDWIPYQRRNFVTPAFPGYVSGHSTFSRAAAEVLTELTGSEYFPGGPGFQEFAPGYLFFEGGPEASLRLEWGTYYDAADQAGQSRLFGGIHVSPDDFDGRRIGALVGKEAVDRARQFFGE